MPDTCEVLNKYWLLILSFLLQVLQMDKLWVLVRQNEEVDSKMILRFKHDLEP